jgi:phage-related protein
MNLEELQIKIGIELKELNKQLKQASDDINKTLGPKATKKMMADNNKVIKDGFKIMEKTTKDSAKQINRDLNDAFDIDKTLVKFNKSIDRSMEQAKRSVRSACNDIRRELNAALNVKANINVSASTSAQRQSSSSRSDTAAIMASSQYTAAMIVKAVNGMIDAENKNTTRLEGAVSKSTNKIVSELNKINTKNSQSFSRSKSEIETEVKTSIKVFEDGLQNEVDKLIQSITPSEIETSINVEADELQNEVNKLIQSITPPEIDTSINVKADGLQNEVNKAIREVDVPNFKASIDVKADGLQNEVNKVIREVNVPNFKTSIDIDSHNLRSKVNAAIKNIKVPTIKVGAELYYKYPDTTEGKKAVSKPQRPDWYNPTPGVEKTLSSEIIDVDAIKSVTSKAIKEFDDIRSELGSLDFKVIEESLIDIGDYVEPLKKQLEPVTKELLKVEAIDDEKISLNLDASDAKEQLRIIHEMYEDLIKACKTNNLNELKKALGVSEQSKSSGRQYPAPPPNKKDTGFSNEGGNKGGKPPKPPIMRYNRERRNDIPKLKSNDIPDYLSITSDDNDDYLESKIDIDYSKIFSEAEEHLNSLGFTPDNTDIQAYRDLLDSVFKNMVKEIENSLDPSKIKNTGSKKPETELPNFLEHVGIDFKEIFDKLEDDLSSIGLFPDIDIKAYFEVFDEVLKKRVEKALSPENIVAGVKADLADLEAIGISPDIDIEEYYANFEDVLRYKLEKAKNVLDTLASEDINLKDIDFENFDFGPYAEEVTRDLEKLGAEMTHNADVYVEAFEALLEKRMKDVYTEKIVPFKEVYGQAVSDKGAVQTPIDFESFKEAYIKAAKEAAKIASQIPVEFKVVASGAENLKDIMNLPEFKDHAEALADIFKRIDFADELETNLDLDGLLAKLKGIQSIDDIDINLDDLRQDLIKFLEQLDKIRVEETDEIKIKVIDDEIVKATKLLKELDDARRRFRGGSGSGGSGSGSGGGNIPPRRRLPGADDFPIRSFPVRRYTGPTTDVGNQFDSHVAIHKAVKAYEKIKEKLNEIKDEYKKLANTISKITNKITAPLKKISSGLKGVVGGIKTAWNKITSIFKKGAKDCEKATNGLSLKLKDLLKTALSFGSIYGLINIGKQAITESQELAQAESKLTALMRQRMGATNDTVKAIRNLAAEQAKAGVVSETAMVKGAEQLSMYVHSAKALKELMPAIANMTARRGGLFATPDDAEEIATQLGEAIREGTTTPLEQSGIYLSEAEIEKFKKLRTEEERAEFLADEIAKSVGNINEALANTPHGQIAQLKNNFKSLLGTLGTLLVNVIQPIVKWLNVIVVAATNALKALGELLGFDMSGGGLMGVGDVGTGTAPDTGGIDDVGNSLDDAKDSAEEAEEAVEKFKGSLMGFDEINILSNNLNDKDKEKDDPTNITPGEGGQLDPGEYVPPEITEGENIFTKFGEKMKAFIDEFLEPFKKAWELYGNDLKEEWKDLIESFKHFCDSLGSFLKSVWDNGGKEFVQHMAEIGLACAKAAMEIGGEILDSLARLWDHLDPSKNMHTQRLLDVLNEVSEKIRDFILGLGDHFESLMANGGQDVLNALGDCFMDLGAAAVNGLGVAIDALDGLIDHLDPAVNENTRNMLQALADMFHATGQAAWDFSELLRSALENGGQDMINAFGDMMMNLGETVARVITTMMESFSKFFDYIDPAKNDITKGMMKAWEEAFLAIGDMALGFAELFESVMANGGQDVLNKLGDAFNSLVGLVGTCVQEIADAMNGLFEHLDPKTNEFTQNMLKAWEEAFESISGMAKDIGEVLGSVMDNGGQEVVNAIGDLGVKIVGAFGKVTGTVADCVGDLFKHLDPAENDIAKGALESFEYFINSIGDFVDSLADALGTFMDNGGQEFVNNMGDIIALIGDLAFTIGGDILNAISTFMDSWLGHAVISTCATALELVSEVLKGLLEILEPLSPIISGVVAAFAGFQVASKVVGFISSIVSAFQALGGAGGILALVKGGFTALWAVLAANPIAATVAAIVGIGVAIVALYNKCEGFREFIDGILKGFQDLFNELKEHFSTLLEDVRNIFGDVIDIITGIFEGDGQKVGEAVRNLILDILKLIGDMKKAFIEVGWALIKGLVQGIWECIKAIPSLLAGIGEFVVDFFKGLFGIHSPSTVFADLGKNLIEGLVKGITDSINLVTGAFKKVCDAITNTIKDISKAVSDKFKEIKDGISEKLKETKEVVSEKWSEIKTTVSEKAKETYDAAKDNWANLKQTVSERARETYEAVKGNWENLKQNTIDRFKETYDVAQERFTNIREAIKEKATKTFEDVSNSWTKIKEDAGNKLEQIKTDAEKRYEDVKNTLVNKIEEAKKGIVEKWEEVRNKTNECIENVRQTSEEKYNEIKETIVNRLEDIKSSTEKKWEEIKKNTGTAVENIKKEAEEQYGKIKDSLLDTLEKTKSAMATKWENIKTDAINKVSEIVKQATTKFGEIKKNFGDKLDEVKSSLTSKWKSLSTQAFNGAKDLVSQAKSGLSSIGKTISDAITGSKSKVRSALNEVGKVFSQADWSLPKLKMPHIKITGKWGFNPPSWPKFSVEWYKRGGIIDGITPLGMTGGTMHMAGEAGKEMVVPLENTSFTTKIAKAMGQAVDNAMARNNNNNNSNNSNPFVNNNGDIILQVDGREFARCSINQINKLQRESGRTLLDV